MNKNIHQGLGWITSAWGSAWSGALWVTDRPLTWWVSALTIIALLGTIKNQWFPRKGDAQ